jgi:hypothetical protein
MKYPFVILCLLSSIIIITCTEKQIPKKSLTSVLDDKMIKSKIDSLDIFKLKWWLIKEFDFNERHNISVDTLKLIERPIHELLEKVNSSIDLSFKSISRLDTTLNEYFLSVEKEVIKDTILNFTINFSEIELNASQKIVVWISLFNFTGEKLCTLQFNCGDELCRDKFNKTNAISFKASPDLIWETYINNSKLMENWLSVEELMKYTAYTITRFHIKPI